MNCEFSLQLPPHITTLLKYIRISNTTKYKKLEKHPDFARLFFLFKLNFKIASKLMGVMITLQMLDTWEALSELRVCISSDVVCVDVDLVSTFLPVYLGLPSGLPAPPLR